MRTTDDETSAQRRSIWVRGVIMLFFIVVLGIVQWGVNLLALVQFLWLLVAGAPNPFLIRFGGTLAAWIEQAVRFLTCASDTMPFPWQDWPAPVEPSPELRNKA